MNTKLLGKQGEDIAVEVLRKQGCKILARNFRVAIGELDIVAQDGDVVVFVEVKARRGGRCGTPGQSVNRRKRQKIFLVAEWYLRQCHMDQVPCRFDVIEVYLRVGGGGDVRQIKGAFEMDGR